jgi:hypothetical protein
MEVTSKDWFALDGVSCGTVGLYCDTPPVQIMAERKGQNYYVGSDEEVYKDDDSFSDISFRFNCYAFFRNRLIHRLCLRICKTSAS